MLPSSSSKFLSFLVISSGEMDFAFPLSQVAEVMRKLPLQKISQMPPFLLGFSQIRDVATPIVSLNLLLQSSFSDEDCQRLVLLKTDLHQIGLLVTSVRGVFEFSTQILYELPPMLSKAHPDLVANLGNVDHRFLMVLNSSYLIHKDLWKKIQNTLELVVHENSIPHGSV